MPNAGLLRKAYEAVMHMIPPTFKGAPLLAAREVTITETAGAGVYTASVTLPAGSYIVDIKTQLTALFTAASAATLKVGDVADDDGWFTGVNLKATDLLVGEELNFDNLGGKSGAYLVSATGLRSAAYCAAATTISWIVTTTGATGAAGRLRGWVVFMPPNVYSGPVVGTKV